MRMIKNALIAAGMIFVVILLLLAAALNAGNYPEKPSPHGRLSADQVHVYSSKIVVDLSNATKIVFTDTNSMYPVIDEGMVGVEAAPQAPEEIHVGDIVSYNSVIADAVIIHEVVEIGTDDRGWYARTKGYNVDRKDPEKVRFQQIKGVLVALFL